MFLCMYLSYMIRNRSQKFWDIYQGYLLTFEQGDMGEPIISRSYTTVQHSTLTGNKNNTFV